MNFYAAPDNDTRASTAAELPAGRRPEAAAAPYADSVRPGEFVSIPVEKLRESPTNPRKRFDPKAISELADSIRKQGILMPLLVRPLAGKLSALHEIISGERRFRAAKEAGLEEVPCRVRHLSDLEVLEVQVTENLQRKDLHPLEEAEAYEQIQKLHGISTDELALKVGKSKAYVYARLKLLALTEKGRKALFDGTLSQSVALLVARIPVPKLQEEALERILVEEEGEMSARGAFQFISENYMLALSGAPWRKDDAELVPKAGPCNTCPKRTGAQPELYTDVKGADVCTDPLCFKAKGEAFTQRRVEEARSTGHRVITGREAEKLKPNTWSDLQGGLVSLDQRCHEDPKGRTYRKLLGKLAEDNPAVAIVVDPHETGKLIEAVPRTWVNPALKERGHDFKVPSLKSDGGQARYLAEQKQREAKTRLERTVRRRLHEQVRAKVTKLSHEDLVVVTAAFFSDIWDEFRKRIMSLWGWERAKGYRALEAEAAEWVGGVKEADLPRMLLDLALVKDTHPGSYSEGKRLFAAAKRYGIDPDRVRREVLAEEQARKAKKAPKATKQPGVAHAAMAVRGSRPLAASGPLARKKKRKR